MIYSSTANRVTPNKVTTMSWTGLTLPSKAPKAIREPAQQKSALIRLFDRRRVQVQPEICLSNIISPDRLKNVVLF